MGLLNQSSDIFTSKSVVDNKKVICVVPEFIAVVPNEIFKFINFLNPNELGCNYKLLSIESSDEKSIKIYSFLDYIEDELIGVFIANDVTTTGKLFSELHKKILKRWPLLDDAGILYIIIKYQLNKLVPDFFQEIDDQEKRLLHSFRYEKIEVFDFTKINTKGVRNVLIDVNEITNEFNYSLSRVSLRVKDNVRKYFDYSTIFEELSIEDEIDCLYLETDTDIQIKTKDSLNDEDKLKLRKWLINSNNAVKHLKGLVIRFKTTQLNNFQYIQFYKNYLMVVKFDYHQFTPSVTYKEFTENFKVINDIISKINYIIRFRHEKENMLNYINYDNVVYIELITEINIFVEYSKDNILNAIKKVNGVFFKKRGDSDNDNDTKHIIVYYIFDKTIRILFSKNIKGGTVVKIRNCYSYNQLVPILKWLIVAFENHSRTELSVINIKQLKKQGLKVNSRSCQKIRQPVINKNTGKLECKKEEYPHLGMTIQKVPCCFKKPQDKKKLFGVLNEIGVGHLTQETKLRFPLRILKRNVITTQRVLHKRQYGVSLLRNEYYRVGLDQTDLNVFLNIFIVLGFASNSTFLQKITDTLIAYKSFFSIVSPQNDVITLINNDKLKKTHDHLLEVMYKAFGIHILIINSVNLIDANKDFYLADPNDLCCVINLNDGYYEPVVSKTGPTFPKKLLMELIKVKPINLTKSIFSWDIINIVNTSKGIVQIISGESVVFLFIKEYGLIPVKRSVLLDKFTWVGVNDLKNAALPDATTQWELLNKLYKEYNLTYLQPMYFLQDNNVISAIEVKSGLITFTKLSNVNAASTEKYKYKYNSIPKNIEEIIGKSVSIMDNRYKIINKDTNEEMYHRLVLEVSEFLNDPKNIADRKMIINSCNIENVGKIVNKLIFKVPGNIGGNIITRFRHHCYNKTNQECDKNSHCSWDHSCKLKMFKGYLDIAIYRLFLELKTFPRTILKGLVRRDNNKILKIREKIIKGEKEIKNFLQ